MTAAVSVSELGHRYPARKGSPARQTLSGVSFEVPAGETFGVLGPNGSGKTTLFRILSTYFPPSSGRALLFGLDARSRAAEIRRRLGVVFQNPSLDGKLTVAENLTLQGRLYGLGGAELKTRTAALLERYGLAGRADDPAQSLSGGLKRRAEIAKSLLHEPELLILDEPSTGLDPGARKDLWEHLSELQASRRMTLLVTTHLMDEADRCGRLLILDGGRAAALGAPAALKAEIGGDVISISSSEPEALRARIKERFSLDAAAVDGSLRLERRDGHAFIPQLVEAFPGLIAAVSLSKPTLEDVFIRRTGRRFWAGAQERA